MEPSPKHKQTKIQKPQILSATVKNKPSNTQIKKAKASKSVKVTPKSSKKNRQTLTTIIKRQNDGHPRYLVVIMFETSVKQPVLLVSMMH